MSDINKIENNTPADPAPASDEQNPAIAKMPDSIGEAIAPLDKIPDPMLDAAANPEIDKDPEVKEEKPTNFKTKGEKLHKWGTYLGVDWILNAATGATFTYWGNFTKSGKKYWSGPITENFTKLFKPLIKNEAQLLSSVEKGNTFMSIIAGGMFTIPPLMILENNKIKKSIVQFLDNKLHGKEACENDENIKQAHADIETAPKKDFIRGNTSRFAALAPLLALVTIPFTKELSNKFYFSHIGNGIDYVATKMGLTAERVIKNVPLAEAQKRWKFIVHEALPMDFGLGIPYAVLHAFFYNLFAGNKDKKDKTHAPVAETTAQPAPVVVEPEAPAESKRFTDTISPRKRADTPPSSFTEKAQTPNQPMSIA